MLSDFAALLQRRLRLPFALAIAAAILIPLAALATIFGLFGTMMVEQFIHLSERFRRRWRRWKAGCAVMPLVMTSFPS